MFVGAYVQCLLVRTSIACVVPEFWRFIPEILTG
jgi:hypothetical protein